MSIPVESYLEYPEVWIALTEECRQDYLLPTHKANLPSRTTYPLTGAEKQALNAFQKHVKAFAINSVNMDLHEHVNMVLGLKYLLLAPIWGVNIWAIKKLLRKTRVHFRKKNNKQKKNLRLIKTNEVLCVRYPNSRIALHGRPIMIVPNLNLFKTHDALGHQIIAKVMARVQERHTCLGIRKTIDQYVSQCLTC